MSSHPEFPTLLAFDGLEACILVDGKEVPHYAIECNEAKREISCWVESQAEKPFAYRFRRSRNGYDCTARAYLDGKSVEHSVIPKNYDTSCLAPRNSVRISRTEKRKLVFGSLELTDDDTYLENSQQNIGEIKIVFEKVQVISKNPAGQPQWQDISSLSEGQKMHERSKKALSHQVRYGEIVQTEAPLGSAKVKSCGILATFIFRYRPLAMLQATGIAPILPPPQEESVPRTPPPVNKKRKISEVKQENDDDGDEEQDDIDARERALLAELEKVRQERLSKNDGRGHSKRVKQEPQAYFTPGEIIDLT